MIKRELFKIGAGLFIFTALASFTVAQDPTPSPTVSPSPTELPTPMPSPTPTPNITPTPTPSPTLSPTVKMAMVAEYFPPTEKNSGGKSVEKTEDEWAVIEYPEGTEVTVELKSYQIRNAKGWARVMRTADGTFINLNVSGLPNNTEDYYVYTVDQAGTVSLLEEITVENGMNKACLQTPMSKFMLLISPKANLKTYNGDSAVIFRSRVPEGYALLVPNNY